MSMTASISVNDGSLSVELKGADQLWALKSRLDISLAHVVDAAPAEDEAREWLHGVRLAGTHIPGVISTGRFYDHGSDEGRWLR
jgi:hypothetical protein